MNLLSRYSRINVAVTIVIYVLVSLTFYFLFNTILLGLNDRDLKIERDEIREHIRKKGVLPELLLEKNQIIQYRVSDKFVSGEAFATVNSRVLKKPFRRLNFNVVVAGKVYDVKIFKPLDEKYFLLKVMLQVTLIAFAIVMLIHFFINRFFTKRLWKPFYSTLDKVQQFELTSGKPITFPQSAIMEFQEMNAAFERTLEKAQKDYYLLKEFNENAAHELQTPLAIIRTKLDLLIKENDLSEKQLRFASGAYLAVQRLARLNNALLLLMKIENHQFAQMEPIQLKQKLEEKISEFEELAEAKSLQIFTNSFSDTVLPLHQELCEILLNNLFSNAIEHNVEGGIIRIELYPDRLIIANTGYTNEVLPGDRLFGRFLKANHESHRTGLGLSIVKKIAEVSALALDYKFRDGFHTFTLHINLTASSDQASGKSKKITESPDRFVKKTQ